MNATSHRCDAPRYVVAYLRASTEDQKLGPEAQRASIDAYAQREGLTVLAYHTDQGVSGATPIEQRPSLVAALAQARANRCSIIVAKRDRLARDAMLAAMIERALPKGQQVISSDGTGNGSAPADQFMRTILDGAAEYERALIRSRTKQALQAKRAKGERAGNVPFGYTADASGILQTDPTEQAAIQRAKDLRQSGASLRAIQSQLAHEKVIGRSGKPLALTQIARILR